MNEPIESIEKKMFYRLEGKTPVPCSMEEAAKLLVSEGHKREVAVTRIHGIMVSTVFLPWVSNPMDNKPRLHFETKFFVKGYACPSRFTPLDDYERQFPTYEIAEEFHRRAVAHIRRQGRKIARNRRRSRIKRVNRRYRNA